MDILQIIVSIVASLAYGAAAGFAIMAWIRLYRMQKDVKDMKHTLAVTGTLVVGMHVKSIFAELSEMKRTLKDLVEKEQFEEAEKMQALIAKAEKKAMETIEHMNSAFGDIAEIQVTKTNQ